MLDHDMLAPANSACLAALSRSDRRVLALLLVRVDCVALCCAVLAEQRAQRNSGMFPNIHFSRRQLQAERGYCRRWENMPSMPSEVGETVVTKYIAG